MAEKWLRLHDPGMIPENHDPDLTSKICEIASEISTAGLSEDAITDNMLKKWMKVFGSAASKGYDPSRYVELLTKINSDMSITDDTIQNKENQIAHIKEQLKQEQTKLLQSKAARGSLRTHIKNVEKQIEKLDERMDAQQDKVQEATNFVDELDNDVKSIPDYQTVVKWTSSGGDYMYSDPSDNDTENDTE